MTNEHDSTQPGASETAPVPGPRLRKPHQGHSRIAEWVVVASVLVSLSATFLAVFLFMTQATRRAETRADTPRSVSPEGRAEAEMPPPPVATRLEPEDTPQAVVALPPPEPDMSVDRLRHLDERIAAIRRDKARADIMAWSARAAADWLSSRAKAESEAAAKAQSAQSEMAAKVDRIEAEASALADKIAALEIRRDDAAARLEAAQNRKGYSILPYRGTNGAWQRPLPIECARDVAQIMPGGPSFRLIDLELSGLSRNSLFARIVELAVRKAASQATPDGDAPTVYVLFVVRPSGIKAYYEARARLQAQGVAFGYELIEEDTSIDYPDLGDLTEWPGYVAPDGLADAGAGSAMPGGFGGSGEPVGVPGRGAGEGQGAGSAGEEGTGLGTNRGELFVWRNGLDGRGPAPAGTGAGGGSGSGTSGEAGSSGLEDGRMPPDGKPTPRVDFGPGTLSQLGRSRGGGLLAGSGNGTATTPSGVNPGGSEGGSGSSGVRSQVPSLEPPWGKVPDGRRGSGAMAGGGPGSSPIGGGSFAGVPGTPNQGTFSDLVAELAAQGELEKPRSLTRPGAVPIMPGDLAEPEGADGFAGGRSSGGPAGLPEAPAAPSPFGTRPPTLPRFEPAPTADATGRSAGNGGASASGAAVPEGPSDAAGGAAPPGGMQAGSPTSSAASAGASGAGGGNPPPQPRQGLRNSLRRLLGAEERLPEKAWEISLTCDADGITIRPGEHRLNLNDLQTDPDLLPRTLQAMFERQARENPDHYWRPYVKYRLAAGGQGTMEMARFQLAQGFVRWPAIVENVAQVEASGVTR